MSDEIVGICVLCNIDSSKARRYAESQYGCTGDLYMLWVTERKANGQEEHSHLPFYDEAISPRPKTPTHVWAFRRDGKKLKCSPSVNNQTSGFHNSGQWEVDYVEVNPRLGNYDCAALHRILRELEPREQIAQIESLKASGHLL